MHAKPHRVSPDSLVSPPTCHDHQVVGALIQHGIDHTLQVRMEAAVLVGGATHVWCCIWSRRGAGSRRDHRLAASPGKAPPTRQYLLALAKTGVAPILGKDGLRREAHGCRRRQAAAVDGDGGTGPCNRALSADGLATPHEQSVFRPGQSQQLRLGEGG